MNTLRQRQQLTRQRFLAGRRLRRRLILLAVVFTAGVLTGLLIGVR